VAIKTIWAGSDSLNSLLQQDTESNSFF